MKKRCLWLLLILLLVPALAGAASYEITDYRLDIQVDTDGTGHFQETLTYDFDDAHNGFLATIRHEDVLRPSDFVLQVDGGILLQRVDELDGVPYTYTAASDGTATSIQAYAPGSKGTRTFSLSYDMGGFAQRYLDTARINHKLLYSDVDYGQATFTITLPQSSTSDIDAFLHGGMPDNGLSLKDGTITIGPSPVAAQKLVEVDVLFPETWIPDARVIQTTMYQEALEQEAKAAAEVAEANARASRMAQILAIALLAGLVAYVVISLLVFLRLKKQYGLKHTIQPITDDALLSDLPAAQAQVLKEGAASASGLSAALLELTALGALTMQSEGDDTAFSWAKDVPGLAPHQQFVLDWLFAGHGTLYVADLDADDNYEAANAFTNQYNAWKQQVFADTVARGWVYNNAAKRMAALLCVFFIGLILSFFMLRYGLWPFAIPGIIVSLLFALLFSRIRKLTDEGEERLAALNGFIANYEDRLTYVPESILGKTPLIMALGYMRPLADWIDNHPASEEWTYADTIPTYWMYAGWHHSMTRMEQNVREAQSHNAGTQSAGAGGNSASGSSGGGFTGGTGGSSHGAW